ncbi:peptide/nickel transport system permease protein [Palleronia aestuarii]|uniref:Peptide/nickel transport system permease protein n=1 Tax=Palleronia aestuarii TaxID=568105 RepID=A0A2W7MZZ5_9RHOB|nr:ABC transporter permease [Palleronia aestuarii]PZX13735.1 peptide/nickel transport system permease protein [Palleronia aestuarii]
MNWLRPLLLGRLLRLAWLLPLATIGLFTLVSLAPIDPVQAYIGDLSALVGPEQRAAIAATWGLDQPAPERFLSWLGGAMTGDLGRSLTYGVPVAEVIERRLPASLALIGIAFVLSFVLGTALGIAAAASRGGRVDRLIRFVAVTLSVSPGFWIALLLIAVFAVGLGWLPACCAAPPGLTAAETGMGDRLRHLVLPVATLSLVGTAPLVLHTRQRLLGFLESPAALHLRAHGLSWRRVAFGAGLRHALGPALALHLAGAGELFGGSVLAETIFAWPGLGQATVRAATGADAPLLMGIGLATLLFVFCGNLLADVAAQLVDPRLRRTTA